MTGGTGVFHPGRQHAWQTAQALQEAAALAWFATALFYQADRWPYRLENALPQKLGDRLRRYFQKVANRQIDPAAVRIVGAWEWSERLAAKLGWLRIAEDFNRIGNRKFQRGVVRLIGREPVQRLWGYDTSCADVFERARRQGIACVLDRSIGHPASLRQIIERERLQFPDFFVGQLGMPSDASIEEANREIAHADHIVVGSQFCADTLIAAGAKPERTHIVPYGYDPELFSEQRPVRSDLGVLPIRFLFIGTVSPRKGVHHLFEAFRRIPKQRDTLTVVGPLALPPAVLARYEEHIDYRGPLSRTEVADEFARAHCFIFPSLFEGSGVVLCEAIASGIGIVQSRNAGDGVRSGASAANGIELDEISADAIQAAVEQIAARPQILRDWAEASWALRPQRSWQAYRRRIRELLPSLTR
jgi:glycosyltransferase involved in cell wall biosynthesis